MASRFPEKGLATAVGDEDLMAKQSKNIAKARAAVTKPAYPLSEAVSLLQQVKFAKFDETVDLTMRLGVDTRHADQMVRGTVVLPHGLGVAQLPVDAAPCGRLAAELARSIAHVRPARDGRPRRYA